MESPPLRSAIASDRLYPRALASLPDIEISGGSYRARFAHQRADLEAIQRLRFEVFNLELGEGLASSFRSTSGRLIFTKTLVSKSSSAFKP